MSYSIQYYVPCQEGLSQHNCATIKEVAVWLDNNQGRYEWSLDNVTVLRRLGQEVDAYELVRRYKENEPLEVVGLHDVELAMSKILHSVRINEITDETMGVLQHLQNLVHTIKENYENKTESRPSL